MITQNCKSVRASWTRENRRKDPGGPVELEFLEQCWGHRSTRTAYVIYTLLITSPTGKENIKKKKKWNYVFSFKNSTDTKLQIRYLFYIFMLLFQNCKLYSLCVSVWK